MMACSCLFCTQSSVLEIWITNASAMYHLIYSLFEPNYLIVQMILKDSSGETMWSEFIRCFDLMLLFTLGP